MTWPATEERNFTPTPMAGPSSWFVSAGLPPPDQMLMSPPGGGGGGGPVPTVTVRPGPGDSRLPLSSAARERIV